LFRALPVELTVQEVVGGDGNLLVVLDLTGVDFLGLASSFVLAINVVLTWTTFFHLVRRNFIDVMIVSSVRNVSGGKVDVVVASG